MPKFYNCDAYPLIPRPGARAVEPGDSTDFSDEEVANGIGGAWSAKNPYEPLAAPPKRKKTTPAPPESDEEE